MNEARSLVISLMALALALPAGAGELKSKESKEEKKARVRAGYACVADFIGHAPVDPRPLPPLPGAGSVTVRALLVAKAALPADPLTGETGDLEGLAAYGFGASAVMDIDESGRLSAPRHMADAGLALKPGELLSVYVFASKDGAPAVNILSAYPHSVARGKGGFAHQSSERLSLQLQPAAGAACTSIIPTLEQLMRPATDQEATSWEKSHPEIVAGVIVESLREGMTTAEVESIMGAPERRAEVGGKTIYFYPKLKVTFTAGKVTGIE